jgi:hypothetical protein
MSLAEFTKDNRAQTTGKNRMDDVNSYLSGKETDEAESNIVKKGAQKVWDGTDMVEKLGGVMGGFVGPIIIEAESEAEEMNKDLSNNLPLGEYESDVHSFMEDLYEFKDQYLIGYPRNAEDPISKVTLNADKVGHYSVGYLTGGLISRGVDKLTDDYDPKKIALGGALGVATYAVAKEGFIEGGEGLQFDLENMDVWGDWAMDTAGMTHSIYNFHKRKTAENGEEPEGVLSEIANKAGRIYGKTKKDSKIGGKEFNYNNNRENSYLSGNTVDQKNSILGDALDSVSNYGLESYSQKTDKNSFEGIKSDSETGLLDNGLTTG